MTTTRNVLVGGLLTLMMGVPNAAGATKYMTIGQAVKTFIPKDTKIFKVKKKLSSEHRLRLVTDYGWTAEESAYTFYVGRKGDEPQAYVFVVPEIFNTCFHKYAIGMDADGEVIETVIVELSCPRSFKIRRKSFLAQFGGKEHDDPITIHSDIDAVTGATLSSEAASTATRKAVSLHNLFFGGGKSVDVSDDVKAARAKAAGMIQKAIETGETMEKEGKTGAAQLPEDYGSE